MRGSNAVMIDTATIACGSENNKNAYWYGEKPDGDRREITQLVGQDVDEHPTAHARCLAKTATAKVEPHAEPEAGTPQRRQQRNCLYDDAGGRTNTEKQFLT